MNVTTLCLSILYERDTTGYDIRRRCVDGEYSYFGVASFGSIYPALTRLEKDGFVTSRVEQQSSKPAKKIFSITDAGRRNFVNTLFEPLNEDRYTSPFLLFARYVHILPKELVEQRVAEFQQRHQAKREKLEAIFQEYDAFSFPPDAWIINLARAITGFSDEYLRTHMHDLIKLARGNPAKDAAE